MGFNKIRQRLYDIIFEADTRAGKTFDIILLVIILISVLLVMLESIESIRRSYASFLKLSEWVITIIFSIEYILRILVVKKPFRYVKSFYGIVDFLAVIPTYLSLLFVGSHSLMVIRAIRLLRVFRIFKLTQFTQAGRLIARALWNSLAKISVFLIFVITLVTIIGTVMYMIEGEANGFSNIPISIYWAIVTLTTVGYGDLSPATPFGQFLASIVMLMGYSIIAVPTGIVTAELISPHKSNNTQVCNSCMTDNHDDDARFCKKCGHSLYD